MPLGSERWFGLVPIARVGPQRPSATALMLADLGPLVGFRISGLTQEASSASVVGYIMARFPIDPVFRTFLSTITAVQTWYNE